MAGELLNGMGMKRYGAGALGLGAVGYFAPPSPGDEPMVLLIKLLPILAPIVMDGAEKVVKALGEAFSAYKTTVNQAQAVVDKVTAVIPPVGPGQG